MRHSGFKEFIDHVLSLMGRPQVKPITECLRGVATYPQGDMKQGRYGMTLTDLMNTLPQSCEGGNGHPHFRKSF